MAQMNDNKNNKQHEENHVPLKDVRWLVLKPFMGQQWSCLSDEV